MHQIGAWKDKDFSKKYTPMHHAHVVLLLCVMMITSLIDSSSSYDQLPGEGVLLSGGLDSLD